MLTPFLILILGCTYEYYLADFAAQEGKPLIPLYRWVERFLYIAIEL